MRVEGVGFRVPPPDPESRNLPEPQEARTHPRGAAPDTLRVSGGGFKAQGVRFRVKGVGCMM